MGKGAAAILLAAVGAQRIGALGAPVFRGVPAISTFHFVAIAHMMLLSGFIENPRAEFQLTHTLPHDVWRSRKTRIHPDSGRLLAVSTATNRPVTHPRSGCRW